MLGNVFVERQVEGPFEQVHRVVRMEPNFTGGVADENRFLTMLRNVGGQLLHLAQAACAEQRTRPAMASDRLLRRQDVCKPLQAGVKFESDRGAGLASTCAKIPSPNLKQPQIQLESSGRRVPQELAVATDDPRDSSVTGIVETMPAAG